MYVINYFFGREPRPRTEVKGGFGLPGGKAITPFFPAPTKTPGPSVPPSPKRG